MNQLLRSLHAAAVDLALIHSSLAGSADLGLPGKRYRRFQYSPGPESMSVPTSDMPEDDSTTEYLTGTKALTG